MSEFPVQFRKLISVNATKRRQYMSLNVQAQGEGVYAFCPLYSILPSSSPSLALLPSPFPRLLLSSFIHLSSSPLTFPPLSSASLHSFLPHFPFFFSPLTFPSPLLSPFFNLSPLFSTENSPAILPENAMSYAVYLIAHHPQFSRTNTEELDKFKECVE